MQTAGVWKGDPSHVGAVTFPAALTQKVIRAVSMATLNKEGERCSLKVLHG